MVARLIRTLLAATFFVLVLGIAALAGLANASAAGFGCGAGTTGYYPPTAAPTLAPDVHVPAPPEAAYSEIPQAATPIPAPPATVYQYPAAPAYTVAPWFPHPGAVVAARPAVVATPGVVVRPKVYVRGQPIRNFWRAITP